LKPIQMPNMDMDELFQARGAFNEEEWIDVLLRSMWRSSARRAADSLELLAFGRDLISFSSRALVRPASG
jgi:predicted ATP-dependent Lon-type protease